jgi:Family of unknown function (DUF6152)
MALLQMRSIQMHKHMISLLGILSLVMSLWVGQAMGHHGWSGYDSAQTLSLTGTIQESGYEHPHGYVKLAMSDKVWLVVLAPPSRMENRGLPRTTLAVGTQASVVGYPSRSDPNEMRAERITIDGKTVELR